MRALLAFDKFKDAVSARDACRVAAEALQEIDPQWTIDLCPLTDGGEGFAEILTASAHGEGVHADVAGPLGASVKAGFGLVELKHIPDAARERLELPLSLPSDSRIAIIEMAAASGLALLPASARNPWQTSTAGTGQLMRLAADAGARAIVLGLGGSATSDLGLGALAVLGLEFRNAADEIIASPIPSTWDKIARISGSLPATFPFIRVACDVTNPLLGPNGCAAVYGPQKGLQPQDLPRLDASSARMAALLIAHCRHSPTLADTPGAGAAGGIAFGLMAAANARLLSGFTLTSEWFDLLARIRLADVVLTGEGRFDESSAQGKGPGAILGFAAAAGRPAHVFAGQVSVSSHPTATLHQISPADWPRDRAIQSTRELLRVAVQREFRG